MCRRCRSVSRIWSIVRWVSASRLGAGAGDGSCLCPVPRVSWPSSKRRARSCLISISSITSSISARLTVAVSPVLGWPSAPCLRVSASKALSLSNSFRCSLSFNISRNWTSCIFTSSRNTKVSCHWLVVDGWEVVRQGVTHRLMCLGASPCGSNYSPPAALRLLFFGSRAPEVWHILAHGLADQGS